MHHWETVEHEKLKKIPKSLETKGRCHKKSAERIEL